jgi:hypothetical protein
VFPVPPIAPMPLGEMSEALYNDDLSLQRQFDDLFNDSFV